MSLSPDQLAELEAMIFASGAPATAAYLRRAFPRLTPTRIAEAVKEINQQLVEGGRPYEIAEVGERFGRALDEVHELVA